ncbi:MAG: GNAT family N-acetyltransferase [Bacilli bacterium]
MIRLANINDVNQIMEIVNDAINFLKENHVNQWQNGYPNREIILNDIKSNSLYVYENTEVLGFAYISSEEEPSYKIIDGAWLTLGNYMVVHRIAVKKEHTNKGIAKKLMEEAITIARSKGIKSIRVDTHRDNLVMNNFLKSLGFVKCGEILLIDYIDSDKLRTAYELIIN